MLSGNLSHRPRVGLSASPQAALKLFGSSSARARSSSPRRRVEPVNERRELIPSGVQDPEEIVPETNNGVGMSADEHYKEHYQRPAEGPAHDSRSLLAAKRTECGTRWYA